MSMIGGTIHGMIKIKGIIILKLNLLQVPATTLIDILAQKTKLGIYTLFTLNHFSNYLKE